MDLLTVAVLLVVLDTGVGESHAQWILALSMLIDININTGRLVIAVAFSWNLSCPGVSGK
jgi:hypothetical protein